MALGDDSVVRGDQHGCSLASFAQVVGQVAPELTYSDLDRLADPGCFSIFVDLSMCVRPSVYTER